MKVEANTANAKRAHIQMLLYLGLEPGLRILEENVPATMVCDRERYWIQKHHSPYLLNSTRGGEGFRDSSASIYALSDPRSDQVFYVGMAINVDERFKQHILDATNIVAIIDRAEQHRQSWRPEERELIYSGADAEATARALGRTVEAVRSHAHLYLSLSGFASRFVREALQAALDMHKIEKLRCPPHVKFYPEERKRSGDKERVSNDILEFAKDLAAKKIASDPLHQSDCSEV